MRRAGRGDLLRLRSGQALHPGLRQRCHVKHLLVQENESRIVAGALAVIDRPV